MTKLGEDITIMIGGEAVRLVPRLRHALALERRPGSFKAALDAIEEGSLTVAAEIIRPHHPAVTLDAVFADLDRLKPALVAYVIGCTGVDTDEASRAPRATRARARETQSFGDHLVDLFKRATGYVGWSAEEALNATPLEIRLAVEGRIELLRSIFGGNDEDTPTTDDRPLDDKVRTVFGTFGTVKVKREATP